MPQGLGNGDLTRETRVCEMLCAVHSQQHLAVSSAIRCIGTHCLRATDRRSSDDYIEACFPPRPTAHPPIRIDAFEYGCCRTPPSVGESVTGRLSAYPPAAEGQFVATAWDRERDVVVVGGISARWDPAHGDPLGQSIVLALSWHDDSLAGVEATGIVSSVHQLFYEPAPDPRSTTRRAQTARECSREVSRRLAPGQWDRAGSRRSGSRSRRVGAGRADRGGRGPSPRRCR